MALASNNHSPIQFFKIITATSIEAGKLRLPNDFTRKYSGAMSNPVFLKAPGSTSWEIHWSKHDSQIWFQKGWEEFVKFYSLDHGHLVVFEFKDACHFGVKIFGKSTLEIEYPSNENQDEEHKHNPDQIGYGAVRILDEIPLSHSQPCKKFRTGTSKDVGKGPELRKRKQVQVEDDAGGSTECLVGGQLTSTITDALHKAKGATFIVEMKSYSIERYSLSIPSSFARQHLKKERDIRLEVLDGRSWMVHYNLFKFSGGWKNFTTDNNLKVGDVCVFELTKRETLSLKVLIFPLAQGGEASTSRRASKLNLALVEA